MPYDPSDKSSLPSYVRNLSGEKQRAWAAIWNRTYTDCQNSSEPDSGRCESKAFSVASGVVINQKGKAQHSMGGGEEKAGQEATFKQLSAEGRKAIPRDKFLFIDSDGKPHLPVHDQSHIANAISRLGNPKTGRKWGLSASKRANLQARARKMLDRAQHSEGPHVGPAGPGNGRGDLQIEGRASSHD